MPLFESGAEFFDLLERQSSAAQRAARELEKLAGDISQARFISEKLKEIESEADKLTHELINRADQKFLTPFDKEDLHKLSQILDDLTDNIEATGARIVIYRIDSLRPDFAKQVKLLVQAVDMSHTAVADLKHIKNHEVIMKTLIGIHSVEGESDQVYRQALDGLFGEPNVDAMTVIRWKDIYDRLEMTIDACEDIADMIETMAVKYA
jgi:predicted phosphate transport protein (TIGR00153 family)